MWCWNSVLSICLKRVGARMLAECRLGRPGRCKVNMAERSSQGEMGECGLMGCGGGVGRPRVFRACRALTSKGCRAPGNQTGEHWSTLEVKCCCGSVFVYKLNDTTPLVNRYTFGLT